MDILIGSVVVIVVVMFVIKQVKPDLYEKIKGKVLFWQ
jgi:di/tricarboxylate transporter|tara:strand:- start:619 stop:732 length:114 start_codon:yes stop_codon:yes gene_type:complete